LYNKALTLLKDNQKLIETIATALFEKEILVWEDICRLTEQIGA
jgi:ATP-dependent Zn protease